MSKDNKTFTRRNLIISQEHVRITNVLFIYLFIYLFFTKNPPNTNSCFPRNNNHSKIGQTHGQLTPNTKPHSNPPKIMKRRQCSCPKPIHCGLKSFLGYTLTLVSIHLHTCWPSIFIMDVFKLKQEFTNRISSRFTLRFYL